MLEEQDEALDDLIRKTLEEVEEVFLIHAGLIELFQNFDAAVSELPDIYLQKMTNFRVGIEATISTAVLPYNLIAAHIYSRHRSRFGMAEAIRALKISEAPAGISLEDHRKQQAAVLTERKFQEFLEVKHNMKELVLEMLHSSKQMIGPVVTPEAAENLLKQCLIVTWTNFEALFRDILEVYLNENANLAESLLKKRAMAKKFGLEKFSLDDLAVHNFDLSKSMGSILVTKQDLSDLRVLKDVYRGLFPTAISLHQKLADRKLWLNCQNRHLLVHRRGVIDKRYLEATGSSMALGETIKISPSDLEALFKLVVNAATELALILHTTGNKAK